MKLRRLLALIACWGAGAAPAAPAPVGHDLTVRIDPAMRELVATDILTVHAPGPIALALNRRFAVETFVVDGRPYADPGRVEDGLRAWRLPISKRPLRIKLAWRGTLAPLDTALDHRQTLGRAESVTGARGTFLPASGVWYPRIAGALESYRLTLELPAGQRGLVAGRLVEERETGGRYRARFEFPQPAEGIDFMAGPYRVERRTVRSVSGKPLQLRTYFHPEIADLAASYLDSVAGYLALYEGRIGEYPFTEFSVVSSPTPTGFGMPTLTYLGIDVLRLPFIRATSLGHEVLHNWWGNGVYSDYARGNWSEGLTTFMADYAYKERDFAAARDMRLAWLRDFAAVPAGQDRPLNEFTSRTHGTSQIVGYDKAAMLFLMLSDRFGPEVFDAGIRRFWREQRFRVAAWDDVRHAFEAAAGADLSGFFEQWLVRAGAPALSIAHAERIAEDGGQRVRVTLQQSAPAYRLRVPLVLVTEAGTETHAVDFASERAAFCLAAGARPVALQLDPDLRLFRRLAPGEAPPILRQAMLDPAVATVVLAPAGAAFDAARELAAKLLEHPVRVRAAEAAAGVPLLAIGLREEVARWLARNRLPPPPAQLAERGTAQVWTLAQVDGKVLAVIAAQDAAALAALARPLPHYGRQSWLVFDGAKALARGVWPGEPQTWRFE